MITAIVTIVMFLIMISLHEFGHFIFGKLLGFRVLEYAIGFGPAILKKQRGETLYSLKVIPFGGYCKFDGEDEAGGDDPRCFNNRPAWRRIIVIAAGAVFNIILGIILFMIIVGSTSPFQTNKVSRVDQDSYAAQTALAPGDEIVRINGKKVNFYQDIALYTSNMNSSEIEVVVKHENKEKETIILKPSKQIVQNTYQEAGIVQRVEINGREIAEEFIPYSDKISKDESIIGQTYQQERYIIGFIPVQEDVTIFNILPQSVNMTKFAVKMVYQSVWDLIRGAVGIDQLSGPVGVVKEVNTAVNSGQDSWLYVLRLAALLTINLGVFNLLPLPALDGGRLFFILIEIIRRKPISPEKEGLVHAIGLMLLFALMIFVSFQDIMKLFRG